MLVVHQAVLYVFFLILNCDITKLTIFFCKHDLNYYLNDYSSNCYYYKEIIFGYGLNDGKKFIKILEKFLYYKFRTINITFKTLYDLTGKELIIIGTNLDEMREEVFFIRKNS